MIEMRRHGKGMSVRVGSAGDRVRWARLGALVAAAFLLVPAASSAQMRMSMGDGVALTLPDGNVAVLVSDSAGVTVRGVVAAGDPAPGAALLMEGDRIVTLQGEAVASLGALTAAYGAIAEGVEVVLGVLRAGGDTTVRFPRPPHQAEGRHMVVQGAGGGAGAWTTTGPPGGGPTEMLIAGVRIRNNDRGMAEVVLRGSDPAAAQVPLRVGDVIVSVNGSSIAALAGLELFYAPLAVGDEVVLEVERRGARETLRFAKPAGR